MTTATRNWWEQALFLVAFMGGAIADKLPAAGEPQGWKGYALVGVIAGAVSIPVGMVMGSYVGGLAAGVAAAKLFQFWRFVKGGK